MKLSDIDKSSVLLSSFGILVLVLGILSLNSIKNWEISIVMMGTGILLLNTLLFLGEKNNKP